MEITKVELFDFSIFKFIFYFYVFFFVLFLRIFSIKPQNTYMIIHEIRSFWNFNTFTNF